MASPKKRPKDGGAVANQVIQSLLRLGMTVRAMKADGDELVFTVAVKVEGA